MRVGRGREHLYGQVFTPGRVAEWQTRWLQVPVFERMWGFKSPLAHCKTPAQQGFFLYPNTPLLPDFYPTVSNVGNSTRGCRQHAASVCHTPSEDRTTQALSLNPKRRISIGIRCRLRVMSYCEKCVDTELANRAWLGSYYLRDAEYGGTTWH